MSESDIHRQLVTLIVEYIELKVGKEYSCFIEADDGGERNLPEITSEGFRPDVFYEYNGTLYIGEAKTGKDISRAHSLKQYASYLRKCKLYQGQAEFIIAVPLVDHAEANNTVKRIKADYPGNYTIKVLKGIV